jgi:hypothetical protein
VHDQDVPARALDIFKLLYVIPKIQAEGDAVKAVVACGEVLVTVSAGDHDLRGALKEEEGAAGIGALGSIVVSAYYYHGDTSLREPVEAPLEDYQRPDLGPDVVKDIAGVDDSVRAELEDLVHRLLKAGIDHLFYPVPAVLV